MRILIDMNLSPRWTNVFAADGWEAVHWSHVVDPGAPDAVIMAWAREGGYVVLTHDLDFGALLAATRLEGPSVVQVRADDVFPEVLGPLVVRALHQFRRELLKGALITIDEHRSRARILPFSG
jgi:predicted nuclease of predicted toxin-antitoxin system